MSGRVSSQDGVLPLSIRGNTYCGKPSPVQEQTLARGMVARSSRVATHGPERWSSLRVARQGVQNSAYRFATKNVPIDRSVFVFSPSQIIDRVGQWISRGGERCERAFSPESRVVGGRWNAWSRARSASRPERETARKRRWIRSEERVRAAGRATTARRAPA